LYIIHRRIKKTKTALKKTTKTFAKYSTSYTKTTKFVIKKKEGKEKNFTFCELDLKLLKDIQSM